MTIALTTASQHGITLVADRAISEKADGVIRVLPEEVRKVFYSSAANIGLACWGSAKLDSENYESWLEAFTSRLTGSSSLTNAATALATELNAELEPTAVRLHGWGELRRGIHVSGYVDGLPCIYHVHTGEPNQGHHSLRVHRDFPDLHGGGEAAYRKSLAEGMRAQLFNGYHELFGAMGAAFTPLRKHLENEFDVQIPAPTLRGQLELDRALVRLAGGLLRASDRSPEVSTDVYDYAFDQSGRFTPAETTPNLPRLKRAASSDVTMSTTLGITQSLWEEGVHADAPDPRRDI